jgi:hypothetical protein
MGDDAQRLRGIAVANQQAVASTIRTSDWAATRGASTYRIGSYELLPQTNRAHDLDSEAYNTPLQVLLDAWSARFGDAWTDHAKVVEDPFFKIACTRLFQAGHMEIVRVAYDDRVVVRKIPDAHL